MKIYIKTKLKIESLYEILRPLLDGKIALIRYNMNLTTIYIKITLYFNFYSLLCRSSFLSSQLISLSSQIITSYKNLKSTHFKFWMCKITIYVQIYYICMCNLLRGERKSTSKITYKHCQRMSADNQNMSYFKTAHAHNFCTLLLTHRQLRHFDPIFVPKSKNSKRSCILKQE